MKVGFMTVITGNYCITDQRGNVRIPPYVCNGGVIAGGGNAWDNIL